MSKRFLNSEIWDKEEFLDSNLEQKLLFFYIVQRCSNIGVFDISLKMASFQLGFEVTREKVLSIPSDIEELKDGAFWLPKFCHHQYGELSETCKPHLRYISDLKKMGLFERVCKGYAKGIETLEEKEEEKEKDKEEEKEKESEISNKKHSFKKSPFYDFEIFRAKLSDWDISRVEDYYKRAKCYSEANGGKYLNWILAVKNWERNDSEKKTPEKKQTGPVYRLING